LTKKSNQVAADYPLGEEIANSITHGLGALLSIAGTALLLVRAARNGGTWYIVSFAIYGTTLILLYLFSTFYHALAHRTAKNIFARMDHAAIFLLIAGTYTPFLLISLRGPYGWMIFLFIWAFAITGVVIRSIYLTKFRKISTVIYVLLGWSFVLVYKQFITHIPAGCLRWLLYGGIAYTVGVLFYAWKKLPYGHAIWHLFVLAGAAFHFAAVLSLLPVD